MQTVARGITGIDLRFQQRPQVIAAALIDGAGGPAVIDPGPGSCLPALGQALAQRGLAITDLRAVLLTHIHLDHAGATGALVRHNPAIQVYVHERGVGHMVDPSRLLASARLIWGDRTAPLWGEVLPVPQGNVQALRGGERVAVGDRHLEVAYTPGHAGHHVTYFDHETRIAFVGDVAGVRIAPAAHVMPPTPPPDLDIEAWQQSIARVDEMAPDTLFLTHFGPHHDARAHLQRTAEELAHMSALAKRIFESTSEGAERSAAFARELSRHLRRHMREAEAEAYETAAPPELCWLGFARYWQKRTG